MTIYDPSIIQKFADRLYARATSAVLIYTSIGLLVGFLASFLVTPYLQQIWPGEQAVLVVRLLLAIIVGLVGLMIGLEHAFTLKLQAQTALCQMQIEKNTRGNGEPNGPAITPQGTRDIF